MRHLVNPRTIYRRVTSRFFIHGCSMTKNLLLGSIAVNLPSCRLPDAIMCLTVVGCTCGPAVSVAALAQQAVRARPGGHVSRLGLATGAPRSEGQLRSVRGACGRHGGVNAVGLPSATAAG